MKRTWRGARDISVMLFTCILVIAIACIIVCAINEGIEARSDIADAEAKTVELENQIKQMGATDPNENPKDYINMHTVCKVYWPEDQDNSKRHKYDDVPYYSIVQFDGSDALYIKSHSDGTLAPWFDADGTLMTMRDLKDVLSN